MKKTVVLMIALCLCMFAVASESSAKQKDKTDDFSISVNLIPYAYQRIGYEDNTPAVRNSVYGAGAGIGLYRNIGDEVYAGTELTYEFHRFKGFHDYHDIKLNAQLKSRLLSLDKEQNVNINFSVGLGADFVFRNDGDYGCYMMMLLAGAEIEWKLPDNAGITVGADCSFSVQKGSSVLHLTPKAGYICRFSKGSLNKDNLNKDNQNKDSLNKDSCSGYGPNGYCPNGYDPNSEDSNGENSVRED